MAILIMAVAVFCLLTFWLAQLLALQGRSSRRRRDLETGMLPGPHHPDLTSQDQNLSSQDQLTHLLLHQPHMHSESQAHIPQTHHDHQHHHHTHHHHHHPQPDMTPPPSPPPDMGSHHHSGGFDSGSHHSH